jgi:ribosomal protein S27E
MNIRAKCIDKDCKAYNIEKSVFVGALLGFGSKNERVKCPECGELMRTTKSVAVKPRGGRRTKSRRTPSRRDSGRSR